MSKAGSCLNMNKCKFFESEIRYLGHVINKQRLHKEPEKIKSTVDCLHPKNISELKFYLGMVSYYGKFIKNVSNMVEPFYKSRGNSTFD